MPIFVNEEKEENSEKAVKVFTDRLEPREVFWRNYNLIKNSMKNNQPIPVQVITYYGIGGVGKTSLLREIRKEIEEKAKGTKYCYIDFEKLLRVKDDVLGILNAIKAVLNNQYKFEFPIFDLAAYEYNIKMGVEASKPELQGIFNKNKELNFLVSVINEIPLIGTFTKVASFIDEGNNLLRTRFKDKKLKETFKKLDKLDLDELKEILPYYFAKDLQENLKNETVPFVFQFDTYERIVNELTVVGSISKIDNWLKSPNGLIRNIPNVLWVIAGREKLKWEEEDRNWEGTLEQHLLGDLSFSDSSSFLKTAGITDERLIENIYETTSGVPMYLDMCVDTYYKSLEQNKTVNVDDFLGDKNKLIERFFTYMNDQEKDFVTILSFIGNWTDENIEEQVKDVLGSFSFNLYEKIKGFSFVIHEDNNYKIHETIRKVVKSEASETIRKKFNKAVKEKQEEKIAQIEKKYYKIKKVDLEKNSENKENTLDTEDINSREEKQEEYRKIIREIVVDIEEFLYQKPEYNKENKKEYCEKVSNLIEKIEKYKNIDGNLCNKGETWLKNIINDKTFSETYEYKTLYGFYIAIERYTNYIDNRLYNSKFKNFYYSYKDTLKIYESTKNLYKNPEDKLKQIIFIISLFQDGVIDSIASKTSNKKRNCYFRAYELYIYKKILKEYLHSSLKIDMVYIKLLYIKNDRKEFNKEFELFFEEYQNKKDFSIKKFIVNYGLIYLIKEFEGKTGKGYIFKEYNMKKQAIKESKEKTKDLIEKKDREEYIKLYIESKKEKFFKKYLDKIIDMIILDKNLIIVGDNLRCLCILSQNIDDEPASDELKLKLFKLSLELKNDILNINDSILLDHYYDIIWLYSKFCYDNIMNDYDVFSIEFIKKNKEEFKKLESKAVSVLKDIAEKYKELTGKDDEKEKIKCFRIPALQSAFYKDLLAPIETYREYKEKYKVYDYQILEICRGWFIYFNQSAFSILNNDLKEKELITVFNELYNDFEELVKYTFNNYKIIDIKNQIKTKYFINNFLRISIMIYDKTRDLSYYNKTIDVLTNILKNSEGLPTMSLYELMNNCEDIILECIIKIKNITLVNENTLNFIEEYYKKIEYFYYKALEKDSGLDLDQIEDITITNLLNSSNMEMNLLAKIIYDNNLNDKQRKEIDSNSKSISSYKVQEVIHGKNRIENIFFLPLLYALDFRRNADNSGVETMAYYIKKNLKRSHGEEKFIMSLMYVLVSDDFEVEKVYKVINKKLNGIFKKKENIEYYEKFKEIVDYNWKFILFREKLRNKYKQK